MTEKVKIITPPKPQVEIELRLNLQEFAQLAALCWSGIDADSTLNSVVSSGVNKLPSNLTIAVADFRSNNCPKVAAWSHVKKDAGADLLELT